MKWHQGEQEEVEDEEEQEVKDQMENSESPVQCTHYAATLFFKRVFKGNL